MLATKAAKRYAKALFELAEKQGVMEEVAAELSQLAGAFADPVLQRTLMLPMLPLKARRGIAEQITTAFALHPLTGNFLRVLAENDRLPDLTAIERAYRTLCDHAKGRMRATIRFAAPFSQEEVDTLLEAFRRLTGRTVIATAVLEPELLGGVVVEIAGCVYDASLKSQLHRLGEALAQHL